MGGHGQEGGGGGHGGHDGGDAVGHPASWIGKIAHLAHGAEHIPAVHHLIEGGGMAGKALGGLGKALPWIGAGAGAVQAGAHGYGAYNSFQNEGIHSDKGWEHVGGAALGGAGAALSFTPYGAALAAGEVGVDLLGAGAGKLFGEDAAFNSDQLVGGAIRGLVGDKSLGYHAGGAVNDMLGGGMLGGIAGGAVGGLTNAVAMPLNAANTVGGGIVNWVGNAIDSTPGKQDYWGQGMSAVGGAISNGASAVGGALSSGASAVGGAISSGASAVGRGARRVGGAIADGASAAWDFATSW